MDREPLNSSVNRSEGPEGRVLQALSAALQILQRAGAIRGELCLTSAAIKIGTAIMELFRGSLVQAKSDLAC